MAERSVVWIRLPWDTPCRSCGITLAGQTAAVFEPATGGVWCAACTMPAAPTPTPTPAPSTAGASAQREYERRKAKGEKRLREQWGPLGGVAVALSTPRQSTTSWQTGAEGERRLGARLDKSASDTTAVLHDRRIPGTRANIDHLVITSHAVWVVDAKRYKGRPRREVQRRFRQPTTEHLFVGSRDCTKLVESALHQQEVVQKVLADVPVRPVLCFIEADWPLLADSFRVREVLVTTPRKLSRILDAKADGPLDVKALHNRLAEHFPAA